MTIGAFLAWLFGCPWTSVGPQEIVVSGQRAMCYYVNWTLVGLRPEPF